MTRTNLTRPIAYLTLTLATLAFANQNLGRAEEVNTAPATNTGARYIDMDPQLLPALLPPMSRLVSSPYSDGNAIDNPLGVELKVTTKNDVIKSVITRQEPMSATNTSLGDSFKTESEPTKIQLPRAKDLMIDSPLSWKTAQPMSIKESRVGFSLTVLD
ncbi:MAG: hypothetical protein SH868_11030 [Bythopirellula sp.]|nr:hypothetical protein [Bythopirellula sp.]